jgi:hypothetical protein
MRFRLPNLFVLAVAGLAVSGCTVRLKGVESFNSATTPVKYTSQLPDDAPGKWHGDPGSYGGIANGSGGIKPHTNYGAGASANSSEPVNPLMDQPAKGIGQQPGEYHAEQATGYGQANSPVAQSTPGQVNSLAARSGH